MNVRIAPIIVLLRMVILKQVSKHINVRIVEKKFNDLTGTIFSRTRLTYEQIEIFIDCFNNKLSLRKTAAKMNVDKILCIC